MGVRNSLLTLLFDLTEEEERKNVKKTT